MFFPMTAIHQDAPFVPVGFNVEVYFSGLDNPTSLAWGPNGKLYVSQQGGEIVELVVGTASVAAYSRLIAKVPPTLLGLVFVGADIFVSSTGSVAKLTIRNGSPISKEIILGDLPHGRHQNDEIIYGKDGFLYMGIGSTGDRTDGEDPRSATVVRFRPDGDAFEIFAKGLRNPYGLAFDEDGNLFSTDNGPDTPEGSDELNFLVQGGDYGFPNFFGIPPAGSGTIGPVTNLQTHSSSDGLVFYFGAQFPAEYVGNAFIAQWGANSGDPNIGKRIVRVPLTRTDHDFLGQEIVFATGFEHPIDVVEDREGGLLVADYGSGKIYRISYGQTALTTRTLISRISSSTMLEFLTLGGVLLSAAVLLGVVALAMRGRSRSHGQKSRSVPNVEAS